MPKKVAIDWDDVELRLVAAQCSGSSVKVTDTAILPIAENGIAATLKAAIAQRGLEKIEALIAIGRGKTELRELTLPPVPDGDLPDMVRFQAIRSFASAGESATVDFLVTQRREDGVSMIAAAVGPATLKEIEKICAAAQLTSKRVALRPLSAAALYLNHAKHQSEPGDTVLIDLLADDAEIAVARDGKVVFVRTVRMPGEEKARANALAGELRRSLMACGVDAAPSKVILWGRESVHQDDLAKIAESTGTQPEVVNPFDLVELDQKVRDSLPTHVGRLAPLVGLLASDGIDPENLIDFLNPRKRPEETSDHLRKALLYGVPIAATLLLGFFVYRQLSSLDVKIANLKKANEALNDPVKLAKTSVARTEVIDQYLDGGVNWLEELRSLATKMPPSDEMIVRSISANTDQRAGGGGRMVVAGAVTNTSVIEKFEQAIRDESHQVSGEGTKVIDTQDAYRLGFREEISIPTESVRARRYERLISVEESSSAVSSDDPDEAAEEIETIPSEQALETASAEEGMPASDPNEAAEGNQTEVQA